MTLRAVALGVLLGLLVVSVTHFNDQVIRQTFLIGNHLPAIVFGVVLLLLLAANPLLRGLGGRWMLSAGEIAVVCGLGLVVCGWPASNLMRIFPSLVARPAQQRMTQPNWQAVSLFAYVPGGPPYVAEGYVADWSALASGLRDSQAPIVIAMRQEFAPALRRRVMEADGRWSADRSARREVLRLMNQAMLRPGLLDPPLPRTATAQAVVSHHRGLLDAALPGVLKPAPRGSGVLLNEGEPAEARAGPLFVPDAPAGSLPDAGRIDWALWWPTLRLWIGLALLVGVATLLMMLVVHPQWARRELLPYPTVRFVQEITVRQPGRWWPDVMSSRLFWLGAGVVFALHLTNGLHVWFPGFIDVPLRLDFNGLRTLFPNASRAYGTWGLFTPTIYFTVIGFGYFVTARVSFSLGFSLIAWVMVAAALGGFGLQLSNGRFDPEAAGPALRFGAYLGVTLIVLYLGRRYYTAVARGAIGLKRAADVSAGAVWALRGLLLTVGASGWLLVTHGGVGWVMALALVCSVLMIGLVLARINAETGLFYAQPDFIPSVIFAGLLGYQGLGVSALVVLTLASLVLVADPREAVAPYVANALELKQRLAGTAPGRAAMVLIPVLVAGLLVALVVTLAIDHHYGLTNSGWAVGLPRGTLDRAAAAVNEMATFGELGELTGLSELAQLAHAQPQPGVIWLVALGVVLVLACAAARLRLAWWPLHPVLFLVWGTYPAANFAFSFLLAAAIKGGVVRLGGVRSYHAARPLMVGFIAAELLAVLLWALVGAIYFYFTNQTPESYRIYPG